MSRAVALVTGASGEMGRSLIGALRSRDIDVVALDLSPLPSETAAQCLESVQLDILETERLRELFRRHQPTLVFHLAAILSSKAERDPAAAHRVNVGGTLGLFNLCIDEAQHTVRFSFPSSIAVYGLPSPEVKQEHSVVKEWQWTTPAGIYGCNKLYCELVGSYLSRRPPTSGKARLDFRAIRFPGLISAETLPTGGTTDFAPEMIHAAARGKSYSCFVSESSRLPFMTMPDAVEALLQLTEAPVEQLTRRVYNIRGFSVSAGEIRREVLRHFGDARIRFEAVPSKQEIVDSWPADIDDSRARRDWGLAPRHGLAEAFGDYLVPALRRRYAANPAPEAAANPVRFPQR